MKLERLASAVTQKQMLETIKYYEALTDNDGYEFEFIIECHIERTGTKYDISVQVGD